MTYPSFRPHIKFYTTQEVIEAVKEIAAEEHRSISKQVLHWVMLHVKEHEEKKHLLKPMAGD